MNSCGSYRVDMNRSCFCDHANRRGDGSFAALAEISPGTYPDRAGDSGPARRMGHLSASLSYPSRRDSRESSWVSGDDYGLVNRVATGNDHAAPFTLVALSRLQKQKIYR